MKYLLIIASLLPAIALISASTAYKGRINALGLRLIKTSEGFSAHFYNDTTGVRKIGYGHGCQTGDKCAKINQPITETQASFLLLQDLRPSEACVTNSVKYPKLNEAQFSAMVSFAYSVGCSNFRSSNLLKLLNKGETKLASKEFGKYAQISGTPIRSLRTRREAEKTLFCAKGGC